MKKKTKKIASMRQLDAVLIPDLGVQTVSLHKYGNGPLDKYIEIIYMKIQTTIRLKNALLFYKNLY